MRLLFDIGNTRIKWAVETDLGLTHHGEQLHRDIPTAQALQDILTVPVQIDEVWAVNVAGAEMAAALSELTLERYGVASQFVTTSRRCGEVINGYEDVSQHGVDRWAAVIGAWQKYHGDICVVDAGTAVTIDMVRASGQHEGGFILPGLNLMAKSLFSDTSDIRKLSELGGDDAASALNDWCGNTTISAVQKGALFALRSAITESVNRLGDDARVVLTGGDAEKLLPLDTFSADLCPDLVLHGLRYLIQES